MSEPFQLTGGVKLALLAMALAVFVIANDFTALSVALPSIEKDFNTTVDTVQWVINAYALVFGVLIVTGGKLADMFGRKRAFMIGSAIFAGFSLLGGLSESATQLIICRALMGIGGALMWPATLGMTYAELPEERAGLAGGLIIGVAGLGNAVGPLLGGVLTDELSWRWIFFLNLPVAAFACFVTWKAIHQPFERSKERIDYGGVVTLTVALLALLIALDNGATWGWGDPKVIGGFTVFALFLVGFSVVEKRVGSAALLPGDVLGNREFKAACITVLFMSATFFASLIYLPQFMEKILNFSALKSGAGLLPMMCTFAGISFVAGSLYGRLGPKLIVSAGTACLTIGMALFAMIDAGSDYISLLPGMIILGLGIGLFYSTITTAAITALDPSRSSLAGAIIYMFQIAGGAVGLGLTTTIFATASQDRLSSAANSVGITLSGHEQDVIQGVLAGTGSSLEILQRFDVVIGEKLVEVVRDAFASGMHWAFGVDALLALVGFVVAVLFVGGNLLKRDQLSRGEVPTVH